MKGYEKNTYHKSAEEFKITNVICILLSINQAPLIDDIPAVGKEGKE